MKNKETNKLENIKENSPSAIKLGLEAYESIKQENNKDEYLMKMMKKKMMKMILRMKKMVRKMMKNSKKMIVNVHYVNV